MRTHFKQRGFALATILLVLLVLAMVVAALLNNQNLAVRETSDVLAAATRAQNSHNLHRVCLQEVRQKMRQDNLAEVDWSTKFNISTSNATGVMTDTVSGECQVEAGDFTHSPHLRISSAFDGLVEITDWRYAPCVDKTALSCFTSQRSIKIKQLNSNNVVTVTPQYLSDAPVQTAWRME